MSWGSVEQSVGRFLSTRSDGRVRESSLTVENILSLGPLSLSQRSSFTASQPHSLSFYVFVKLTPCSEKIIALVFPVSWLLEKRSGGASVA